MKNPRIYICLVFFGFLLGCQYDFPEEVMEEPNPGQADFSKMVTVGNSMTAGFMDGALYNRGQDFSFATILAEQLKLAGGGEFNVPEINSENGFFTIGPGETVLGRLVLTVDNSTSSPQTLPAPIGPGDLPAPYTGDKSVLNNFGIPGLTMVTALLPETGNPTSPVFNPFYGRIASNPGASTPIGDAATALADGGTFFTFWLGSNDVMAYAMEGAANPELFTGETAFQESLNVALGSLLNASPEAKGVVLGIPQLDSLPYLNLINPLSIQVPEGARTELGQGLGGLNAAINGWNAGINANPNIPEEIKETLIRPNLSTNFDAYPLLVFDPSLSDAEVPLPTGGTLEIPKIRNLNQADGVKIPLGAQDLLAQGLGISPLIPLNEMQYDEAYLTRAELGEIQTRINSYNGFLAGSVTANTERLLFIDSNEFLELLYSGSLIYGGVGLTPSIIPPTGAYSVDGVHLNARANAFVANYIINGINEKWQSNIPKVNPNAFPGNDLPR